MLNALQHIDACYVLGFSTFVIGVEENLIPRYMTAVVAELPTWPAEYFLRVVVQAGSGCSPPRDKG